MAQTRRTNREEEEHRRQRIFADGAGRESWARPQADAEFLHDVRVEMKQVNWPSRPDVWSTTIVVTVTVAFFGVFFCMTDWHFKQAV